MPQILDATKRDPLRTYQFRIAIEPGLTGAPVMEVNNLVYIAGVRSVSGLTVTIRPFEVNEGGNNLHRYAQPDKLTWEPITLEQGLGLGTVLSEWADAVVEYAETGAMPDLPVKRNVIISVFDESDTPIVSFEVINAWLSKYQSLPKLDAMSSEVGITTIELTHEGYRRMDEPVDLR